MNKVILMGRLTKDPELRYTASSNIPRCTFTLAVDRRFARQGEEKQTDFFSIVAWRSTGSSAASISPRDRGSLSLEACRTGAGTTPMAESIM